MSQDTQSTREEMITNELILSHLMLEVSGIKNKYHCSTVNSPEMNKELDEAYHAALASLQQLQQQTIDTPELRKLMAEKKRLIKAGDALYERASYTGRMFDGTHRLLSAAAHWLDVRGKNSGKYQAELSTPSQIDKGGEK